MSFFDWDEANIAHVAQHGVTPGEAEEALKSSIEVDLSIVNGEVRLEAIGQTRTGRTLRVVSIDRGSLVRVVTAYNATSTDRRLYLHHMVGQ